MESVCFQLWDIKPKVMNRFLIENIDIKEKNDGNDPYKPYSKINDLVVSFPWLFDKQIYQEGNNEEEKEELIRAYSNNDKKQNEELREKYNPDSIFKNKNKEREVEQITEEITAIAKYKKENFIKKLLNKIKRLLTR